MESEAENAHFQPSEWGFLTTKHSPRFENDGAYEGNDSDFKECPKRQNKPQNAQEYDRGESVLFILLNES